MSVLQPAHADMATASGELAAARHEATQSQARFGQARDTAELRDIMDKLKELGGLVAQATVLVNPEDQ
jgi:hypothetical protein